MRIATRIQSDSVPGSIVTYQVCLTRQENGRKLLHCPLTPPLRTERAVTATWKKLRTQYPKCYRVRIEDFA